MTFPSLPSDSLYKFVSLFGIVIFSLSIYLDNEVNGKYNLAVEDYNSKNELFAFDAEILSDRIKALNSDMIKECLSCNCGCAVEPSKGDEVSLKFDNMTNPARNELAHVMVDNLLKKADELNSQRTAYARKMLELKILKESLDYQEEYLNDLSEITDLGVYIGLFITGVGFSLWYFRVQKYTDLNAKLDLEKRQLEIEDLKKKLNKEVAPTIGSGAAVSENGQKQPVA